MRSAFVIAAREVRSFFVSPMAYVVLTVWSLWSGVSYYFFASLYTMNGSQSGSDSPLTAFFGGTILFFMPQLVFVPVLTMRLLADERSRGSLELLVTAPVSEVSIVLGKYMAAMVYWIALWAPTLLYVWLTSRFGHIDGGTVLASYVGILGIGAYNMSIGLLSSAIAKTQLNAAIMTFFFLGGLFLLGIGQYVFMDTTRDVLAYISVWSHMQDFSKGIVDSRDLIYDASIAGLGLFLAVQALASERDAS